MDTFFPLLLQKNIESFSFDIFVQKKHPEKNPDFLYSKNGEKYPKKYPEKNPKKIRVLLDGRS